MNDDKVIIFDCQLLQTKAWHRGMGKYTARTLAAFFDNKKYFGKYKKRILLFNSNLTYADDLRKYVESLKGAEAVFLSLHIPQDGDQHSITLGQQKNRVILDTFVQERFPDDQVGFLITSLFLDEACPAFPTTTYNSLIYYDLIPLMYYRLYLGLGASELYFTRFSILLEADQIFAISETVANDLVAFLGVPKEKVINIRGASNRAEAIVTSKPKLAIDKPFILMPTGGDPRKNNLNGVKGFARFNDQNGNRFQLVVTSFFADSQKEELKQYSSDIVFSGNVTDSEVWWLYENSEAVLFPAEYEGLGMPILEAIDVDKLIVCSDIAVFREISTEAFFMFDPRDPEAISASLEEVFSATKTEIALKKKSYQKISEYYTWDHTAEIVDGLLIGKKNESTAQKPRVAFVTPNLCQPSEEARYIAKLYPHLCAFYDIDFYYDMAGTYPPVRPNHLAFSADIKAIDLLTPEVHSTYDLVVYVIGNTQLSMATLRAALAMPGLVVLADEKLDGVLDESVSVGFISEKQRQKEKDVLGSLQEVSRAVASLTSAIHAKGVQPLDITAAELAYPSRRGQSGEGRIFVAIDTSRGDAEWNVDVINDIARIVDRSRASFSVVSRTRFPEKIRKLFDLSDISLYEDVSDHEYLTLLNNADLYIDGRPGGSLAKLLPAFEAQRNGLDVFLGPTERTDTLEGSGVFIAKDGASLRDAVFKWLIQEPVIDTPKGAASSNISGLVKLIDELIEKG